MPRLEGEVWGDFEERFQIPSKKRKRKIKILKPIEGATIAIVGPDFKKAETNENGRYLIEDITPGSYKVIVEAEGFQKQEREIRIENDVKLSFLLESIPQKNWEKGREKLSMVSSWSLWIATYVVFILVMVLVIGAIYGFYQAAQEVISHLNNGSSAEETHVTLIKGVGNFLASFTIFVIAVGLHKILTTGFKLELRGVDELERMLVGLIVATLAITFLSRVVESKVADIVDIGESVGLVIIALAIFIIVLGKYQEIQRKIKDKLKKNEKEKERK